MDLHLRFDQYLPRLGTPLLQTIATAWGGLPRGSGKNPQQQYVQRILDGVSDPNQAKLRIQKLEPYQRFALQFAKGRKGIIGIDNLIMMMRLLDLELPEIDISSYGGTTRFAQALVKSGVFIPFAQPDRYGFNMMIDYRTLMTDERLLSYVELPDFPTLPFPTTTAPIVTSHHRPANVILSVLGVMKAVKDLGGIKLTKSGVPQVNSLKKLSKTQHWQDDGILVDGFWFPQPAIALIAILFHSDVLGNSSDGNRIELSADLQTFAALTLTQQIGLLLLGVSLTGEWLEWSPDGWYDADYFHYQLLEARQSLLLVLQLLPLDPEAWYSFEQLSDFLFERVGDCFSLNGPHGMPIIQGSPEQREKTLARLQKQRREQWETQEKPWIRAALSTWLYYFSIVELGTAQPNNSKSRSNVSDSEQSPEIVAFRLTDLGRSLLHHLPQTQAQEAPQPAWIVQPNFEILVYLDEVVPTQIVFLEQYCDRVDTRSHTVQYRITRETVYQGLERGGTLETVIEGLKTGAKVPLPQNVEIDIQQWSQLREQMTLKRKTQILEFTDSTSRQAAIDKGTKGELIGDRFLLLTEELTAMKSWIKQTINYEKSFRSCLKVTETGEVTQTEAVQDLIFQTQLERWTEPQKKGVAFTQASVAKAAKLGHKPSDVLNFLEERLTHAMPPLLRVALTAWAGRPAKLEMEEIIVLRCMDSAVFEAIVSSQKLRSHFIGQLSPSLLLVDRAKLKALKKDLEWLGITPAIELLKVPTLG